MKAFTVQVPVFGNQNPTQSARIEVYGQAVQPRNYSLTPPIKVTPSIITNNAYGVDEADIGGLQGEMWLLKPSTERLDHALVLVHHLHKANYERRYLKENKVFQARQIVCNGTAGYDSTYTVITLAPGDNGIVRREWYTRSWFRKIKHVRYDVIAWDGLKLTLMHVAADKLPPLSSPVARPTVRPAVKEPPAANPTAATPVARPPVAPPVVQRTPMEEVAYVISQGASASAEDLQKAVTLLKGVYSQSDHDEGWRAVFVRSACALSKLNEGKGQLDSAIECLRLAMLIVYATPDDGSSNAASQRKQISDELQRLHAAKS